MRAYLLILPILLVSGGAATAATDPASLDLKVAAFAGAVPGAEGGARAPVDRRLRLADCAGEPALSWRTDRRDAVVVSCAGPVPWRIFVPVRRSAPSAPAAPLAAVAGPAVPAPRAEAVIRRGDPVTLSVETGGFVVTQDAIALSDAAAGARLRLKVEGSTQTVQGIAVEPGHATVPGG